MWDNAQISPGHTTSLMLAFRAPMQLVQPAAARGAQVARGRFRQARRIDGQDTGGITQMRVHDERGNSVTQGCTARGAGGWLWSVAAGLIFRVRFKERHKLNRFYPGYPSNYRRRFCRSGGDQESVTGQRAVPNPAKG